MQGKLEEELTLNPVEPLAASQYAASDLSQISPARTPHLSRDMSVPNSARDWDILVFLSPCLLRHAPTFKRSGHPAEPISGERFGRHGDIRFWTYDKCQNQIFSIFYISSSTRSLWGVLQSPFLGGRQSDTKERSERSDNIQFWSFNEKKKRDKTRKQSDFAFTLCGGKPEIQSENKSQEIFRLGSAR